ncbi:MAG: hypothetical protein IJ740_10480 [Ruminococcus sp.]|nr:hypothetical protein [Ruminococcus sp.]
MIKRLISSALALGLVLGAALPFEQSIPAARAEEDGQTYAESDNSSVYDAPWTGYIVWASKGWAEPTNYYPANDPVYEGGCGNDVYITPDNTHYTVSLGPLYDTDSQIKTIDGCEVFEVNIAHLGDYLNADILNTKNPDGSSLTLSQNMAYIKECGLDISNVTVYADDAKLFTIPDDKLLYGSFEGNGDINISIYYPYREGGTGYKDSEYYIQEVQDIMSSIKAEKIAVSFDIKVDKPEEQPVPIIEEPELIPFDTDHVDVNVTLKDEYYYDGTPKTPAVNWVKYDGVLLTEGVDYTVSYKNNVNIGTACITINGIGKYCDYVAAEFFIVKKPEDSEGDEIGHTSGSDEDHASGTTNPPTSGGNDSAVVRKNISKATVTGIKNKVYTGKAIKPAPTVKLSGKALKKGTDYTVSYKNNTKVGKATVTIKGKGNYTGTVTKTFKINPKATSVSKLTSPKTKQLKAKYKKVSGVTGYQVTYSTSSKFTKSKTKTVTVKGAAKTSKTIKKLTKGKKYYVKVRSYKTVGGTKYYRAYSKVKSIKVK